MKNNMKESRFRFSHLILFLFLFGAGCFFGYLLIHTWIVSGFDLMFLLYIPTIFVIVVIPLWGAIGLVMEDIKNIKSGKSTSLYAEEENK